MNLSKITLTVCHILVLKIIQQCSGLITNVTELRNICNDPQPGKGDVIFIAAPASEVLIKLNDSRLSNMTKLHLTLLEEKKSHVLDLGFLYDFQSLEQFWIASVSGCKLSSTHLNFTTRNGRKLSVKHLHFSLKHIVMTSDSKLVISMANSMNSVEVLDFKNSGTQSFLKSWSNFTASLSIEADISHLQVLCLQATKSAIRDSLDESVSLNFTEFLEPLQNSSLEVLDISYNNLHHLSGNLTGFIPRIRILDVSHNSLMYLRNRIYFMQILYKFHKLEIVNIGYQSTDSNAQETGHVKENSLAPLDGYNDCSLAKNDMQEKVLDNILCRLHYFNHNENYVKTLPSVSKPNKLSCAKGLVFPISRTVTEINLSGWKVSTCSDWNVRAVYKICFMKNNLKKLFLRENNKFVSSFKQKISMDQVLISGLEQLNVLDFEGNQMVGKWKNLFFTSFPNLREMNMAGNLFNLTKVIMERYASHFSTWKTLICP